MKKTASVRGFKISDNPRQYFAIVPGKWLINNCTPSPRITDPIKGFQRLVNQGRARKIAKAVIDKKRNFPNAIILASQLERFDREADTLHIDATKKLFVVDGQHRLWAQHYSETEAFYRCLIHCGLDAKGMAELFLEINDNQKRVPSSLRWDLYRLVDSTEDPLLSAASSIVKDLNSVEESPLFGMIDLTGEEGRVGLKQGSLAPEIYNFINTPGRAFFRNEGYLATYELFATYISAIRALDSSSWKRGTSQFYQARILRVLIRLLPEIVRRLKKAPNECNATDFISYLRKIDPKTISSKEIIAKQGSAGMGDIYKELRKQIF